MIWHNWRVALRVARVLVGLGCLGAALAAHGISAAAAVWLAFSAYAIVALAWQAVDSAANSLLTLFIDIISFLLWLYSAGDRFALVSCAFFCFVMLFAGIFHTWRETAIFGGVSVLFLVVTRPLSADNLVLAVLAGGIIGCAAAAQKHLLNARLADAGRQTALLRSQAEKARENERQRIAADFHDGPLQSFISFQMRLQIVRKTFQRDAEAGMRELEQLQELCRSQVAELRAFVRSMRPPDADGTGIATAVGRLLNLFQKDTGVVATFHRGASLAQEEPEASTEILQVIREALNNVQKHSKASRVAVSMDRTENALVISIEDDGTGFPLAGSYSLDELDALHLGPVSIKRRVRDLGGEMTLESRPGHGAGIEIRIPL